MNRVQSKTFHDYASLSSQSSLEVPSQQAHTDLAELKTLGEAQGLGYDLYDNATGNGDDDEFEVALTELGIAIRSDGAEQA
jgi:hypothetical protein